jgi:hemerythrin-like domain-containing protein
MSGFCRIVAFSAFVFGRPRLFSSCTVRMTSQTDIIKIILHEHEEFKSEFKELENMKDKQELNERWRKLADYLELHASAEEALFYPRAIKKVKDSKEDTKHAVKDHNEIRQTTKAVGKEEFDSKEWWKAFSEWKDATIEHLEEEEEDVIPPFEKEVSEEDRNMIGEEWRQFYSKHHHAKGLSGAEKDPEAYVEKHEKK